MTLLSLKQELSGNTYPGRGIVAGRSADGRYAVTAYFIMGRSVNSRNRVFITDGEGIRTQAFDPSKLTDPSLIIYAPVRVLGEHTIVTNGDQTDTVYDGLKAGKTFAEALESREFEPDAPNYTPRISALLTVKDGAYSCRMSILKSADGILPAASALPSITIIPGQGKDILSILTSLTAARFRVSGESRPEWPSRAESMISRRWYGRT